MHLKCYSQTIALFAMLLSSVSFLALSSLVYQYRGIYCGIWRQVCKVHPLINVYQNAYYPGTLKTEQWNVHAIFAKSAWINFQVASGARGRGVLRLLLVQQQIILFCIPAICLQLYIVVYPSAILPILPCLTLEILLMMVTTNGTIGHLTVALGR